MNSVPLVSVIVPIYNVEKYVGACVDSILMQSYKNLEIILVNDGSTDNSREIIQKYEYNPCCRIVDKPNGGSSSARNAGLSSANGEYVYFIDSDDMIHEQAVELLVNEMIRKEADFCCYRIAFVSEKNGNRRIHGHDFKVTLLDDPEEIFRDTLLGINIKTTAWSNFFRRSFLVDNSIWFQEGIINEDSLFSIICSINAHRVAFLNRVLYYALERTGSISRNIKKEHITTYSIIFNSIKGILESKNLFAGYKNYYYAGYTKQVLFALVQIAFRVKDKQHFLNLFRELEKELYMNVVVGKYIKLVSNTYYLLYRLSLYPALFYRCICLLRLLGIRIY